MKNNRVMKDNLKSILTLTAPGTSRASDKLKKAGARRVTLKRLSDLSSLKLRRVTLKRSSGLSAISTGCIFDDTTISIFEAKKSHTEKIIRSVSYFSYV